MSGRNVKHNYIKSTNLRYWFFVIILLRPWHYLYFFRQFLSKMLRSTMDIFANKYFHHSSNRNSSSEWYFVHNSSSSFDATVSKQMKIYSLIQYFLWNNEWVWLRNPYIYLDSTTGVLRLSQLSCTCFVYKYKWPDWFLARCCF